MGNSEVGHMNLGSGRVVPQGVTLIDAEIASGEFASNETLRQALAHVAATGGTLHLMGLLSDGQVHSSIVHLFALIDAVVAAEVPLAVHCFLDGRDTPPRSATTYVERLEAKLGAVHRVGAIASIVGRYYAMDRDGRWERTKLVRPAAEGRASSAPAMRSAPFATVTRAAKMTSSCCRPSSESRAPLPTATPSSSSTFAPTARGS